MRPLLFENVDSHETPAGVMFGAFVGPHDGAKIDPRRVLRPLFFEKVDFSKNERRLGREHDFDPPEVPR